ncbi:MAG TPA: hypothetical protein GXX40_08585 [Firmicutes bacterium]|nr:hypothetical protein [Bacillota bacterium]
MPYFRRRSYLFGLLRVYDDREGSFYVRLFGGRMYQVRGNRPSASNKCSRSRTVDADGNPAFKMKAQK